MKNVLVTGAAGFLGSHLAEHYVRAGHAVWGIDNFSSSSESSMHHRNLLASEQYTFNEVDICDPFSEWFGSRRPEKFDIIYNFACPASPPKYQEMPIQTMLTCVRGTANVLRLAGTMGSTVVHASTSEVYGDPDRSPQHESYRGNVNPYGPRACYDEGKRAAEALCFDYLHAYGADVRLVRIFNTFGENMDPSDGRVVSNFICQALRREPLTVYGRGQQTRSFCYVDDLIRGIIALGELKENPGEPINLGNPNEFTVNELATLIVRLMRDVTGDVKSAGCSVKYGDLPVDDPLQRCPDISRAKQLLGWEPKVGLEEGLVKTIAYFRNHLACRT